MHDRGTSGAVHGRRPYTLPATTLSAVLSADTLATLRSVDGSSSPASRIRSTSGDDRGRRTRPRARRRCRRRRPTTRRPVRSRCRSRCRRRPGHRPAADRSPSRSRLSTSSAGTTRPTAARVFALGTEREPALLDCSPAAIRSRSSIPWSDAGRTGSAGRYAFEPEPRPARLRERGQARSRRSRRRAHATPTRPCRRPVPAIVPSPRPIAKAPAGRIASTRLTSRGGKVEAQARAARRDHRSAAARSRS